LESTRAKEAEVRKETAEQLEIFRKQREAAEKVQFEEDDTPAYAGGMAVSPGTGETWVARPKKRRRDKESAPVLGAKLRKMSSAELETSDVSGVRDDATVHTKKPPGQQQLQQLSLDWETTAQMMIETERFSKARNCDGSLRK
jgi:hypothetical protein